MAQESVDNLSLDRIVALVGSWKEIIADVDAEFAKQHPEFKNNPLTRGPEDASAREAWNQLFMRNCLHVLGRYRDSLTEIGDAQAAAVTGGLRVTTGATSALAGRFVALA